MNETATHCNTLQHTATHCNTLQHTGWYSLIWMSHVSFIHVWYECVNSWEEHDLSWEEHDLFTWHIHVNESCIIHPCVIWMCKLHSTLNLSCIRVTWLIHTCDMTHSYVWHDSFIRVTWLIRTCDMTHSYVWHDSFVHVTWLIRTCDMTYSHVWHDLFIGCGGSRGARFESGATPWIFCSAPWAQRHSPIWYKSVCMYVYMYVCIYTYVYTYVYIYMYAYQYILWIFCGAPWAQWHSSI